jgi:hypothetical protein
MGQAGVASAIGAEALLWNPALIARARREVSLNTVSGVELPQSDLGVAFVYPIRGALTVAFSWRYLNNGEQEAAQDPDHPTGTFVTTSSTYGATFAAPFGNRWAAGVALKALRINFNCTGTCPNEPDNPPLAGAVDIGGQFRATTDSLITIGASLRNLGPPLQYRDSPQADPLPARLEVGVEIAPRLTQFPTVRVRGDVDIVTRISGGGGPGFRFGGEVSWLERYHGRAGFVLDGPYGTGPSVGAGGSFARWRIDFAQFLSDLSEASGAKPTYLSFRYVF